MTSPSPLSIKGVADLSAGRCRLRVSGADRVGFLHGQCTNDIQRLRRDESCYAAFLNAKGKMRGEAYIVCRENEFLLEASAGLCESLEKFVITEDVVVEDISENLRAWLCVGMTLPGDVVFDHALGTGVLSAAVLPVTIDASELEAVRIEAGIPAWGMDMDENTIPVEAGLSLRGISYDKGCYIGQETIARIKTYGHVNRHLVQLAIEGNRLPVIGARIHTGEKEVGHVTSAAYSNRLGKTLALGYVRREFVSRENRLAIGEQPVEVLKICGE